MKRESLILVAFCVSTVFMLAGPAPRAGALGIAPPPCYNAPKLCVSAFKIPGDHHWHLAIGGPRRLYMRRYGLCVTAPDGMHACDTFRIRLKKRNLFYAMVTWNRHFPDDGPGRYVAHWRRPPNHTLIGTRAFTVHH